MPVDAEVLRTQGTEVSQVQRGFRTQQVIAFLKKNKNQAYTQQEVADACSDEKSGYEMRPQQARQILVSLSKRKIVERLSVQVENGRLIHYHYTG